MAKKRKTREQKQIADLRHNFIHQTVVNTFEARPAFPKISEKKPVTTSYLAYPYLAKDLTKTFLLTASIIGVQILLFISLKTHIIKIPGISY
ncbi:MAG: hypothetical protein UU67_C0093G0003 [Candidatus Daviesbacteria bacterium GW2011_GWB1_41_5]|uniref:Uncharacterized protein n=1 Tax=Candidatus Daviesbacteria bacterium GW2011_GWB1_41_5 TaxID=1618429 RepID=A0A0G0WD62_9BACT|nr:MAG: hypothetical protein UU67_C0093G0003 [Candidatus Daviesbacteria bacterium GW2011_GWB1_41_5]